MKITKAKLLNPIWKIWYSYISNLDRKGEVTFLNYGYADDKNIEFKKEDEINRYSAQLYHHVVSSVKLYGLDVLEVGCGRGGGASYVAGCFVPKSVTGLDLCKESINFCKKHYFVKGLSFCQGDALNLPFADNNFDAVVNVESSHRYPDMEKFLKEVYRVLKTGGYFLFADLRDEQSIGTLREQLNNSNMKIIKEEVITPNVLKALELDHKRRIGLINKLVPKIFHSLTKEFAGTKETGLYKSFLTKKKEYLYYVLQKD
ncbi:MAG: class I SAM-dependent methyltransferase [Candidatus Omnitrophica bacterium]|nr:class I SAM-dependent methyltransferase [Candidatus Omnitrophota bacterium]MBU1048023.1 class I SAM-dependent methyltransferase [Candidatus Omnitrophota bacterium]MBU1631266.1 class I SAM-dependent methyltransferase [Candidatus Omnitrophota bacterium]MBU1889393.1 class I SAM-dependent methyltransferase [Candidatus Omnitrophota bacterium]